MNGNVGYHNKYCCLQQIAQRGRELRAQTMNSSGSIIYATACAAYLSLRGQRKLESY